MTDFQIMSASGVDYRYATGVPEAASLWLVLTGLAAVGARELVRRRSADAAVPTTART